MTHPYSNHPHFRRLWQLERKTDIIKFTIASQVVGLSDYGTFFVLFYVLHLGLAFSVGVAYAAGLTVSYVLSRFWVFKDDIGGMSYATNVLRYSAMLAVNLLLTYFMLVLLRTFYGMEPAVGKIVVGIFMYFWTYLTNKIWVFKGIQPGQKRRLVRAT